MRPAAVSRVLGLVGLALFIATAFTPLPNLLGSWLEARPRIEPADAIVVLGGGGVHADGSLSNTSLRRAVMGIVLMRRGLAPLIVFSGASTGGGRTEAEARAVLARQLGVPAHAILTEAAARTTQAEATRVGQLLRSRGSRRVLLVTDRQGMARAQGVFQREGFVVLPVPADDVSPSAETPEARLALARRLLQGLVAELYYRAAGYL